MRLHLQTDSVRTAFSRFWPELAVFTGLLIYNIWVICRELAASGWEAPLVLLALAVLMEWHIMCRLLHSTYPRPGLSDKTVAWGLLGLVFLLILGPWNVPVILRFLISIFCFSMAVICYFSAWRAALWSTVPIALCSLIIPAQEQIMLFLSHPLRMLSTILSVETLRLFGYRISYQMTTIHLGDTDIAITNACSGIQQMEALLLLAYLLVRYQHREIGWAILHYCFILPAIIVANAIRIIITVLLYRVLGATVLENTWHIGLGYFQVVLAFLFLWGIGFLLTPLHEKEVKPCVP